jgi:chromosome segregation ATPase
MAVRKKNRDSVVMDIGELQGKEATLRAEVAELIIEKDRNQNDIDTAIEAARLEVTRSTELTNEIAGKVIEQKKELEKLNKSISDLQLVAEEATKTYEIVAFETSKEEANLAGAKADLKRAVDEKAVVSVEKNRLSEEVKAEKIVLETVQRRVDEMNADIAQSMRAIENSKADIEQRKLEMDSKEREFAVELESLAMRKSEIDKSSKKLELDREELGKEKESLQGFSQELAKKEKELQNKENEVIKQSLLNSQELESIKSKDLQLKIDSSKFKETARLNKLKSSGII